MNFLNLVIAAFRPRNAVQIGGYSPASSLGMGSGAAAYMNTVRAYQTNEIVSAALNLLATAAAEPHIIGRRWRRERRQIRTESRALHAMGLRNLAGSRMLDAHLIRNGFFEEVDEHPLVTLLNAPNPYMSRGAFWERILLDYYLAGNAYIFKARYSTGLLSGATGELWPLRPDRVKPIPGDMSKGEPFVKGYEYTANGVKQVIPPEDIIHLKYPNPLNPYEGCSPLVALLPRVEIDAAMRRFLFTFYDRGGAGAGASLNVKGKMDQSEKDGLRERFRRMFAGGQFDILVTAADDVTYTPFTLNRGLRDALPKEIDAQNEARISMVLRIQGPILGLLISYDNASYASHRVAWQMFWDGTMSPLLTDFADELNRTMVPEYAGIDEVLFDLSDIHALQEDIDALAERIRKDWATGAISFAEMRTARGLPPEPNAQDLFAIPGSLFITPFERLAEDNTRKQAVQADGGNDTATNLLPRLLTAGRPRMEDDPEAKADYESAMSFKARYPRMTWAQIASRIGKSERQLREIRARFADLEYDTDE